MKRAIIIHGWQGKSNGEWIPWVKQKLELQGWRVETPQMPITEKPKLIEWLKTLKSLSPDESTLLIGHSLANALIMKYLEQKESKVKGALMVAAWDWLMEDVREFHETFFESGFDYKTIREMKIPLIIVNSTNDRWIDIKKAKEMGTKLNAKFIPIENAGHFMKKNGYKEFPKLIEIIENNFN